MPENVFREQLSSWRNSASELSRSVANDTGGFLSSISPFQQSRLRLPLTERPEDEPIEEPAWFTLSRWDRILVFGACLTASVLFFVLCFALFPVLAVKPRKFATIWSLASILFVISFGVLQGPVNYAMHLISPGRLLFTIMYFGSIILTLIFSLGFRSAILTLIAVIMQLIAALWYTVSYFPMGTQSLKFASRIGARQMTSWINS